MWRTDRQIAAGVVLSLALVAETAAAKDLIVIGGEQGGAWQDGGNGLPPSIIVGPGEVSNSNTPGGVIDFSVRDGWMFPASADVTENIVLTSEGRGGSVTAPSVLEDLSGKLPKMIDDDPNTAFERKESEGRPARALGVVLQYDLGARFGVSRIRFFPRNAADDYLAPDFPFQDDFLKAYEILLNDGTKETLSAGLPVFTSVLLETQNDNAVVDVQIEPQYVRYVQVKSQTTVGFEIAEFQVFGEGFVPTAEYHSDIFDMGTELATFGNLRWEQESVGDPLRSLASVSTRSGVDDTPVTYNRIRADGLEVPWRAEEQLEDGSTAQQLVQSLDGPDFDIRDALATFRDLPLEDREEITVKQDDYASLKSAEKGTVRDDLDNWSTWSPPYRLEAVATADSVAAGSGGIRIVSPGPRRFFQFKIEYSSEELFSAKGIGSLSFDITSPALAEEIIAEIEPREARLGVGTAFSLVIVPDIRPDVDGGFSGVIISTPVRVLAVNRVIVQQPDGSRLEEDFSDADLNSTPVVQGDIRIEAVEGPQFQISFPAVRSSILGTEELAVVQIDFESVVLRTGTEFSVQALSPVAGEVPQRAVPGNARALSEGSSTTLLNPRNLSVQVERKGGLLINVGTEPAVLTPNADLVNDIISIHYDVTDLTSGASVNVKIRDLSGRLLRLVESGSFQSGRYTSIWDGTDDKGNVVPPGLYLYTISVDADAGSAETTGTVAVAY
jgi:hypothetical protein